MQTLSSLQTELKAAMPFWDIVHKISERAAERGELGEGGSAIWSIAEWKRFCKAARECAHLPLTGNAVYRTVRNVETMIADGLTARQIHAALFWKSKQDDSEQEKREKAIADEVQRSIARDRQRALEALMDQERMRLEARDRVKAERDEREDRCRHPRREAV